MELALTFSTQVAVAAVGAEMALVAVAAALEVALVSVVVVALTAVAADDVTCQVWGTG